MQNTIQIQNSQEHSATPLRARAAAADFGRDRVGFGYLSAKDARAAQAVMQRTLRNVLPGSFAA